MEVYKKMKQILSVVLVILLTLTLPVSVSAEENENQEFSLSMFENEENYEYDKFDKEWKYYGAYRKEFADAIFVVGIKVYGDENGIDCPPEVYAHIISPDFSNGFDFLFDVEGIAFMVGDVIYKWDGMLIQDGSHVIVAEKDKEFLKALGEADPNDVAIKITTEPREFIFEAEDWNDSFYDLQAAAKKCYETDTWQYVTDTTAAELGETLWPMTIVE